jgi:hypothetical protein
LARKNARQAFGRQKSTATATTKRRAKLEAAFRLWPNRLHLSPLLTGDLAQITTTIQSFHFEGIVAKRSDSQQSHNLLQTPNVIGKACFHRWRDAEGLIQRRELNFKLSHYRALRALCVIGGQSSFHR